MTVVDALAHAMSGSDLSADDITAVFGTIMDGQATPAQIGGLLVALRMKGETPEEIAGAANAMRARATPIRCPLLDTAVDTCGTGGDGSGSVNVSTMAALVVAASGVVVAKHGNRSISSRSGSADVLEALGVNIDAPVDVLERCLQEANIAFLFAPVFHAATRHAAAPRRELRTRTIFNLLGPLTNPAGVTRQVVGVYDAAWCEPVARALGLLGAKRAFVVHGDGGLDELAVRGSTLVAEWTGTAVRSYQLTPRSFGLEEHDPGGLAGGDAGHNARRTTEILGGEPGAPRSAVVMTAALALVAAGACEDREQAARQAEQVIDEGKALATLSRLVAVSRGAA